MTFKFVNEGLVLGEKVCYVLADHTEHDILESFQDQGLDLKRFVTTGQFTFMNYTDIYLINGEFTPQNTIEALRKATTLAVDVQGYSKFRVTGEVSWILHHHLEPKVINIWFI